MKLLHFLPLITAFFVSCNPPEGDYELDYAHVPGANASLSPLGGIKVLQSDVKFDQDLYSVCVRGGNRFISDKNLLLETELAYAAWLSAAGHTEREWELFSFELADDCPDNQEYLGAVVLLDEGLDAGSGELNSFPESRIVCQRSGYSYSCSAQSGTVGLGRWGGAGYSYNPRTGKWIAITSYNQARATFSQNIDWYSLAEHLTGNEQLSQADKDDIIASYEALSDSAKSFDELVEFNKKLANKKIISAKDKEFSRLFGEFQRSNNANLNKVYKPKLGLFHVLLHEVGHNFGMLHAHETQPPSFISVETDGLKVKIDGRTQYVATMAYGESYMYLTADDIAGVKSMRKDTEEYLASKL